MGSLSSQRRAEGDDAELTSPRAQGNMHSQMQSVVHMCRRPGGLQQLCYDCQQL